jgi:hypothetical protein
MPAGSIETLHDIIIAWQEAGREADKRALWRTLARGGWFRACRDAAQRGDLTVFTPWLEATDSLTNEIIQFQGPDMGLLVRSFLWCSLAATWARAATTPPIDDVASREIRKAAWNTIVPNGNLSPSLIEQFIHKNKEPLSTRSVSAIIDWAFCVAGRHLAPASVTSKLPVGFWRDLAADLLGEHTRTAVQQVSLNILLVDTMRNEGVLATLILELVSEGFGGFYPAPELVFLRDADFQQAEQRARAYLTSVSIEPADCDIRWRLRRHDKKPIVNLSGPSLGAAFALGMAKLCTIG